jgi:WD40 repeat protein
VFSIRIQNDVVLSAGPDANVRVWDRVSGRCRHVLAGHSDTVDALDVAPDGRFALSGSADRSMRVWNLESGLCLQTLGGHLGRVDRVAFSNDARFALACSSAGQAVVWELDWDVALDGNAHAADMKDRRRRSPFARLFRRDQ